MLLSPLYTAVTIKAEKMRQALNLLRQYERDGYGGCKKVCVNGH